jgi:hypothetical protein
VHLAQLKKTGMRDWEFIHTIVDNTLHPEFDRLLGFDLNATLALLKEFDITLNVEDPYMEWTEPPIRYRHLRETLVSLIPDRRSMIDINVVPVHPDDQSGFPSEQATGIELFEQVQAAVERNGRACIYCESSVFEEDWQLVPGALAAGSTIQRKEKQWEVHCPATASLIFGTRGRTILIDGRMWPGLGSDRILIPAGTHRLATAVPASDRVSRRKELRLVAISDELLDCVRTEMGMDVRYVSPARCLLTLNRPPAKVMVDGIPRELPVFTGVQGAMLLAPSGMHLLSLTK